jgi:hypothetical protein
LAQLGSRVPVIVIDPPPFDEEPLVVVVDEVVAE